MIKNEQVEIPLNKKKLLIMIIGSLCFVALGLWLIIERPIFYHHVSDEQHTPLSTAIDIIVGLSAILFFGVCFILIAKKSIDNTPGFIINSEGITDNSGGASAGLILWKDIRDVQKTSIAAQNFIMIVLNNPEEYIAQQRSAFKRMVMKMNYRSYDTPIYISVNGLQCNTNDLFDLIVKRFDSRK